MSHEWPQPMTERGRSVPGAMGLSPLTSHTFMVPRVDGPGNEVHRRWPHSAGRNGRNTPPPWPCEVGRIHRGSFTEHLKLIFSLYIYSHTTQQETNGRKNSAIICSSCDFPQGHKTHVPLPPTGLGSFLLKSPRCGSHLHPKAVHWPRSTWLW